MCEPVTNPAKITPNQPWGPQGQGESEALTDIKFKG